jgi:hypothetical protein
MIEWVAKEITMEPAQAQAPIPASAAAATSAAAAAAAAPANGAGLLWRLLCIGGWQHDACAFWDFVASREEDGEGEGEEGHQQEQLLMLPPPHQPPGSTLTDWGSSVLCWSLNALAIHNIFGAASHWRLQWFSSEFQLQAILNYWSICLAYAWHV